LSTKSVRWMNRGRAPQASAILATGGGVIFEGSRDRMFRALNSATGEILWKIRLDAVPGAYPITFKTQGKQYVAVTTGGGGPLDATWRSKFTPEIQDAQPATTLWVFEVDDTP